MIPGCQLKNKKNVCQMERAKDTTLVVDTESKLDPICINSKPNLLKEFNCMNPDKKTVMIRLRLHPSQTHSLAPFSLWYHISFHVAITKKNVE